MDSFLVQFVAGVVLVIVLPLFIGRTISAWRTSGTFNSTADWTPAPEYVPEAPPAGTDLHEHNRRLIEAHLEPGETLMGFTRGFFRPARPQDWKFGSGIEKLPLMIAATSSRILLFEVTVLTVHRHRFITFDEIRSLVPPGRGPWGTSGLTRIELQSGHAYQMGFLGPLLNEAALWEEQQLASHLRRIAPRFASPRRAARGRRAAA